MLHLRGATHRRGVAVADPVDLVPEVQVGIDLQDGQRRAGGIRAQDRNRNRVVTAEHDRHHAGTQQGPDRGLGPRSVAGTVLGRAGYVPDVHDAQWRGPDQQRAVEVEVVVIAEAGKALRASTDGGGSIGAAGGTARRVGHPEWDAQDRNIGLAG